MRKQMIVCRDAKGNVLGTFKSAEEAAEDMLISVQAINESIKTKKKQLDSGFWSYEMIGSSAEEQQPKAKDPLDMRGRHNHPKTSKQVVQLTRKTLTFVAEYQSIYEAQKQTGIKAIAKVCKGTAASAGGYFWMFKSNYDELISY